MNYQQVKQLYLKNGYKFREEIGALNIHAIRSKESKSDKFDDLGGVAWIDEKKQENLFNFWMTTDPGKHWLQNPMKKEGCIIMVPGQYIDVYTDGLHNGEYTCFKQAGKIAYVRDNNKDDILDFSLYRDPNKRKVNLFWDVCCTNLHRAHKNTILKWINKYSAGCQVVQNPITFDRLIELRDWSKKFGFTHWDYSLFEE